METGLKIIPPAPYLGRTDDWFADSVTLSYTHLLRQKHFLRRNLNAEITACDHYPIRRLQYLVEPARHPRSTRPPVLVSDRNHDFIIIIIIIIISFISGNRPIETDLSLIHI